MQGGKKNNLTRVVNDFDLMIYFDVLHMIIIRVQWDININNLQICIISTLNKHETLTQCWIIFGPASQTVDQRWVNVSRVSVL